MPLSTQPAAADTPDPNWRRTLHIMVFCQLMTSIGFSSIFPFLSLYVKSLGSTTSLGTELLAGLVFSCHAINRTIASHDCQSGGLWRTAGAASPWSSGPCSAAPSFCC